MTKQPWHKRNGTLQLVALILAFLLWFYITVIEPGKITLLSGVVPP